MEKEGIFENPVFRTSDKALRERRLVFSSLRAAACVILLTAASLLPLESPAALLAAWGVALSLCLGLALLPARELFARFAARELRLTEGLMEERRGRYVRFLTYEQILHLKVGRNLKEEIRSLEVLGDSGTLSLRGYDNMERLFSELASRRPEKALIEVEDSRYDKGSPMYWAALVWIFGIFLILLRLLVR